MLFKVYKNNITFWEVGTVKQSVGELVFIIQGPKDIYKRHLNQLWKCRVNDSNVSLPQICEEPIDIIFENFDLNAPQASPEVRCSNRKRNFTDPLSVDPRRKKYKNSFFFFRKKNLLEGGGYETVSYPFMDSFKFYINREPSTLDDIGYSTDIRLQVSLAYAITFLCILLLQYIFKLIPCSELSFRGPNLGPHQ